MFEILSRVYIPPPKNESEASHDLPYISMKSRIHTHDTCHRVFERNMTTRTGHIHPFVIRFSKQTLKVF